MELKTYFKDFLKNIEPDPKHISEASTGHNTLRERLKEDEDFKGYHVSDFLQGSYSRKTVVKPVKDVDIVVVVDHNQVDKSKEAVSILRKCLDKYYTDITPQDRSLNVELSYITMDIVVAIAPDGLEKPLKIPDRKLGEWKLTDPKKQQKYTTDLNEDGYFVPLVKMFKWWWQENHSVYKRPKGYILECIAGTCFDADAESHAEGFVNLLKGVKKKYKGHIEKKKVPSIPDPGISGNNVAHRLKFEEFEAFMGKIDTSLVTAEKALSEEDKEKSAKLWRQIFGDEFPEPESKSEEKFEMGAAAIAGASFPSKPVRPNRPGGFA